MIRTARTDDAARIAEIYNYYVAHTYITFETEPVSAAEMDIRIAEIASCSLPWLVCEREAETVGYAYASKWRERQAYQNSVETTVYVSKNELGKGFGRALYTKLISALQTSGRHTAIAGIALPNDASVGLHEALGFKKTAQFHEVGYKFGKWIDVGYWQIML